jgi:hypothetical protein
MSRFANRQFDELVLDLQLFALEFQNLQFVRLGMQLFLLDLLFERVMAALEFDDMTLQGHAKPP